MSFFLPYLVLHLVVSFRCLTFDWTEMKRLGEPAVLTYVCLNFTLNQSKASSLRANHHHHTKLYCLVNVIPSPHLASSKRLLHKMICDICEDLVQTFGHEFSCGMLLVFNFNAPPTPPQMGLCILD